MNFLRKAGKPGLDLRDFCVLLEGLHLNYKGDGGANWWMLNQGSSVIELLL